MNTPGTAQCLRSSWPRTYSSGGFQARIYRQLASVQLAGKLLV